MWAPDHKLNDHDVDPHYLLSNNLSHSPFHRMLHAWALANHEKPLVHIDIHGKMDRKDTYELDLGVKSLEIHFGGLGEAGFVKEFVRALTEGFNRVLKPLTKYKEYQASCQPDPILNGYWGRGDLRTMTE